MMEQQSSTPVKRFQCQRCDRGFGRLEHLQRHHRSHTKEQPFRCQICPKAFTRKDLLKRHCRLSHPSPESQSDQPDTQPTIELDPDSADAFNLGNWPASSSTYNAEQPVVVPNTQVIHNGVDDAQQQPVSHLAQPLENHSLGFSTSNLGESGLQAPQGSISRLEVDYPLGLDLEDNQPSSFLPLFAHDFSAFMDSVDQPLPMLFADVDFPEPALLPRSNDLRNAEQSQDHTRGAITIPVPPTSEYEISTGDSSLSRYGSRLPSLAPDDRPVAHQHTPQSFPKVNERNFFVTAECRHRLVEELAKFPGCVDGDFVLPSRHTLTRFIGGYFRVFHTHYPFFHIPTLELESMHAELLLAIAGLGARYVRESDIGNELYHVAQFMVLERVRRYRKVVAMTSSQRQQSREEVMENDNTRMDLDEIWNPAPSEDRQTAVLEMMQTLVLLIATAMWYKCEPAAADALSIRSVLHSLSWQFDSSSTCNDSDSLNDWKSWIRAETIKRTQLVIFCFFNIHTILFDLPPMMLARELHVDLPSSGQEWNLTNEQDWREMHDSLGIHRKQEFGHAFTDLFTNKGTNLSPRHTIGFSALGGCALIHAVIQQIWMVRNSRMGFLQQDHHDGNLSVEEMNIFEHALKRWSRCWERDQESSMNPLSPHGPVTFTSTAMLRIAYIRLHMDIGPGRSLSSWDPYIVAKSLHQSPAIQRSDKMTRASLHCAHALSIPVKLGINYVAQTQLIHWSNQHALCSLECALLLAKWLDAVTIDSPTPPLTAAEQTVLDFVVQLVVETEHKLSCERIWEEKERLSSMVVRLWARLYQSSSAWQMVDLIGQSLNIYADLLWTQNT